MIVEDIRHNRSGILQVDGKRYPVVITEVEQTLDYGQVRTSLTAEVMDLFQESNRRVENRKTCAIERVIFNDPATIVIWSDKTKTVVKCQPGDTYDPEKGLALCISKKFLGNKGNFNEVFKKWIPESVEVIDDMNDDVIRVGSKVEVIRDGLSYPTYRGWVEKNVKSKADRDKWDGFVHECCNNGDVGRVLYIAEHGGMYDADVIIAYVDFGEHCSMIDVNGLKKIK
jgi:hypothetical protein